MRPCRRPTIAIMASVVKSRQHTKTEKMQQFSQNQEISPQKLLKCPTEGCDKVLSSSPGLRYHLKTHEETRPYSCKKCSKTFKSSNGLKYHLEKTKCEEMFTISEIPSVSYIPVASTPTKQMPNIKDATIDVPAMETPKKIKYIPHVLTIDTNNSYFEEPSTTLNDDSCSPLSANGEPDYGVNHSPQANDELECGVNQNQPANLNWLTELAIIATSPQSPLLQKTSTIPRNPISTLERSLHSYAKPPRTPSPPPALIDHCEIIYTTPALHTHSTCVDEDSRVTSSSPFPASPKLSESSSGTWSHSWPTAVWQCFMKGTRVHFTSGPRTDWRLAEELGSNESLAAQAYQQQEEYNGRGISPTSGYAPNGLQLLKVAEDESDSGLVLTLTFKSCSPVQPNLVAECELEHPFFVKDKGWSSYNPCLTVEKYGIPCCELESGDLCLPPSHPEAISFQDSEVFESFKSFDFTPMDSSAVLALSSMARHRRDLEMSPRSPGSPSKTGSPTSPHKQKKHKVEPNRGKRPMNAFMLFAKKFRLEYTQLYPGKDNRAISVILGDRWKKMKVEERKVYAQEAKMLAEEHKKIHPDCWKRKRSSSTSL
ncbi:HMG box-containing protein 1-like [Glandiceps talaboti]